MSGEDDLRRVELIRSARPSASLVVDANQAWTFAQLHELAPELAALGVTLIEQPLPASKDDALVDYQGKVPLCADESCQTSASLPALIGKYQYIRESPAAVVVECPRGNACAQISTRTGRATYMCHWKVRSDSSSLMKLLRYFFYWQLSRENRRNPVSWFAPLVAVAVLLTFNMLTIAVIVFELLGSGLSDRIDKAGGAAALISIVVMIHNGQYLRFAAEFSNESPRQRQVRTVVLLAYELLSVLAFPLVGFVIHARGS